MEKQQVISFKKEEDKPYITVGELRRHLEDFDQNLPVCTVHPMGGITQMDMGVLLKYNEDNEKIVSAEEDSDIYDKYNEGFKEVLFLG